MSKKESISEDGEITEDYNLDLLDDNCRIFSYETSPMLFKNDVYANKVLIMSQEKYINHQLRIHKFVTANEFYKYMGLDQTISGQKRIKIFDDNDDNRDNQFCVRLIRDGRYISWNEYLDAGIPEIILEINTDQSLADLKRSRLIAIR